MEKDEKYCIYLRKSRVDLEMEKYEGTDTLERHRNTLINFAESKGINVEKIYEEVVSGESISDRVQMQKLLRDVETNRWSGVLVMEVERLARGDTEDQGIVAKAFKYSHTKIITPTKTYDPDNEFDEEYFEFGLFMSRREYKTITRRLQRGREASVLEGKFVGNIAPFGYKKRKLENSKGFTLEIEPEEAQIVKQIFHMFAYQGITINGVARRLNELGIKPRIADSWTSSSIKDIMNNPVYIGKIRWKARKEVVTTKNGKKEKHRPRNISPIIVDGLHKPIIEQEVWEIVQNKRKLNPPPVVNNNVVQNPLVGIVYCGKCGKTMQRRPYTNSSKIPTLMCTNPKCNNVSSKLYIVEEQLIEALKRWLKDYTIDCQKLISKSKNTKIVNNEELLEQLENSLEKENKKQLRIFEGFEDGTYDKQIFKERLEISKNTIKKLKDNIKAIRNKIEEQQRVSKERQNTIPKITSVIDIYFKLQTAEEKNNLLKTILKKVVYIKNEKAIKKTSDPTNFELEIYPRIPKIEKK